MIKIFKMFRGSNPSAFFASLFAFLPNIFFLAFSFLFQLFALFLLFLVFAVGFGVASVFNFKSGSSYNVIRL